MNFNILDSARSGKAVQRPQDYYINGEGKLFYDCDPHGVDMSGRRRISQIDSDRFTVVTNDSTKLREATIQNIVYEQVLDNVGIYASSVKGGDNPYEKRTEAMEAHNKCIMDITHNLVKVESFLKDKNEDILNLLAEEDIFLNISNDEIKFYVNCNDVFYWACSDLEFIEESEIGDLLECHKLSEQYGNMLWACRKRKMRPQTPWYNYFNDEEKRLFDQCGPVREDY